MDILQLSARFIDKIIELFGDVEYTNERQVCWYDGVYRRLKIKNPDIEIHIFNKNKICVFTKNKGIYCFDENAYLEIEKILYEMA